jgi:hypothetical protein
LDQAPALVRSLGLPWSGHVIVGVNGHTVRNLADLRHVLSRLPAGHRVTISLTLGAGVLEGQTVVELARRPARNPAQPR